MEQRNLYLDTYAFLTGRKGMVQLEDGRSIEEVVETQRK